MDSYLISPINGHLTHVELKPYIKCPPGLHLTSIIIWWLRKGRRNNGWLGHLTLPWCIWCGRSTSWFFFFFFFLGSCWYTKLSKRRPFVMFVCFFILGLTYMLPLLLHCTIKFRDCNLFLFLFFQTIEFFLLEIYTPQQKTII